MIPLYLYCKNLGQEKWRKQLIINCVVSYYMSYTSLLGMGRRTSGMRISTRPWYRLLSQSRLQRSTGSYLHSKTRQDFGRRFSDSSWLIHTHKHMQRFQNEHFTSGRYVSANADVSLILKQLKSEMLALTQLMLHLQPDSGWTSRRSSIEFPPK